VVDETGPVLCPMVSTLTVLNLWILQPDSSLIRQINTMEIYCEDGKYMLLVQDGVQWKAFVLNVLKHWILLPGSG
jgi:hypothetical protein